MIVIVRTVIHVLMMHIGETHSKLYNIILHENSQISCF